MSYIRFRNVTKSYKVGTARIDALKNASFDLERGKFTVILGPSGSGKSTLLNLLGGMDNATSGTIVVGDKEITKYNERQQTNYRRNDVGFVFQFYNLIPDLTAFENIDMISKLKSDTLNSQEALKAVGLEKRAYNFPSQMSGGELQRVSIARALCKNANLLLCDEPTGALDSVTGKKILILLHEMASKFNKAVVVVTHNAAIAPAADRVIHLKDGVIQQVIDNESPLSMNEVIW